MTLSVEHQLSAIPSVKEPTAPSYEVLSSLKRSIRTRDIIHWQPGPIPALKPSDTNVKDFPLRCGLLEDNEALITESNPSYILQNLLSGSWKAEAVIKAFISRATIAHYLTNPLSETFFDRAVARAQELDKAFEETGKPVGPLHGLPISLKDVMHISDVDSTYGFVAWIGKKRQTEDRLVTKLYEAGAVFYCKTNVPQALMSGECVNYVFGRTSTPWNTKLSAGGSSGGEGSLISLGGSPLGIGSDIAGSIRTPANFNGIYGLCPAPGRFPSHAAENSDGLTVIQPVAGPLSRCVDGLELYTRSVLSLKPWQWDFSSLNIPWREDEYAIGLGQRHPLCFAFMPHDSVVFPDPPIQRGMQMLREALEKAGHQVIDIDPFDGKEFMDIAFAILEATGGEEVTQVLKVLNEPLMKEVLRPDKTRELSVSSYQGYAAKIKIIRQKYLDIWQQTRFRSKTGLPVDAIILPSGGHVAPPHGTMEYFTYELISNVLEWTCATFPVTRVDPLLDGKPDAPFEPLSDFDKRNHEKCKSKQPELC